MTDYTQLIERLRIVGGVGDEAAQAIEALQARCVELQTEVYKATHRADSFETTNETLKHMKAALQVSADKYEAERDAALAKLAEVEGQEPVAWGVGHDNQWGQRVWFDFTASLLLAGDVAAKHCTQFNSNAEPFPLFARPVIAAGAQPSEAPKTYMQGYSDGKAWAEGQAQQPLSEPISREQWEGACNGLGTQGRGGSV